MSRIRVLDIGNRQNPTLNPLRKEIHVRRPIHIPRLRRLAALFGAAVVASTALVAVTAAPAAARPPDCYLDVGRYVDGGQNIHAWRQWICENGDNIPLYVAIQRFVSPGVWDTVADGRGSASHYCNGHPLNIFRTTGTPEFFNTCY